MVFASDDNPDRVQLDFSRPPDSYELGPILGVRTSQVVDIKLDRQKIRPIFALK